MGPGCHGLQGRPSGVSEVNPGADTGKEMEVNFIQKYISHNNLWLIQGGATKQQGQWLNSTINNNDYDCDDCDNMVAGNTDDATLNTGRRRT